MTTESLGRTLHDPTAATRRIPAGGPDHRLGRVCIMLPAKGCAYDEMVSVLVAVVRELGGDAFLARDGDRAALEANVLILFGLCSLFDASARLLSDHSVRRPATVLWHVEPLPPGAIPAQAEKTAQRLIRCNVNRLPEPLSTLARHIPGHAAVVTRIRRARCVQLATECNWDSQCVHAREWYHAVRHAMWLKQRYSDGWCDFVATSTTSRCRVLTQMGIPCEYAPLGYHPLWGTDRGGNRDIDVVFLGHVRHTGRERLVARIARRLAGAGAKLAVVDRDCYGEDRTRLLNRAKISLDLGRNTWEMPVLRLLVSMACGALVVSNRLVDPYPFRDEHLARVDADSLEEAILMRLHDEPARRRITEAAHRHLTTELAWHSVVSRVLQRALAQRRTCHGGPL